MDYILKCPQCSQYTVITADEPVTEWDCSFCDASPVTSLPTDADGNLI